MNAKRRTVLPAPAAKTWLVVAVGMVLRFTNPKSPRYLVSGGVLPVSPDPDSAESVLLTPYQLVVLGRSLASSTSRRVRARSYKKGQGIASRKTLFLCPTGCEAARLATLFHHLPWQRFLTLTAPPSDFRSALRAWRGLDILNAIGDPTRPDRIQPFWTAVISSHDLTYRDPDLRKRLPLSRQPLHLHMLVGGVNKDILNILMLRWGYFVPKDGNKPVDSRVWSILHYLYAQIKGNLVERRRHREQVFEAPRNPYDADDFTGWVITGYSPLVVPPFYSDNLDAIQAYYADTIREQRREQKRRAGRLGGLARARRKS